MLLKNSTTFELFSMQTNDNQYVVSSLSEKYIPHVG